MNYTTKFLLFYGAAFIVTIVSAYLEAYFDTKKQKSGGNIKHSESLIVRVILALIASFFFNQWLVWNPRGEYVDSVHSDWFFIFFSFFFFVMSIGLLYWVVFDYFKNTTNSQKPDYIGTEAEADKIASHIFKNQKVSYIYAKLVAFGFFTLFYIYLVLDI